MGTFHLCFCLLVLGAANQVNGCGPISLEDLGLSKSYIQQTSTLLTYSLESLNFLRTNKALHKVDTRVASIEDDNSECAIKERQELGRLRDQYNVEVCVNFTDTVANLESVATSSINIFIQFSKDTTIIQQEYQSCVTQVGANRVQCFQTLLTNYEGKVLSLIADITNAIANVARILSHTFLQVLNCFLRPERLEQELSRITKLCV